MKPRLSMKLLWKMYASWENPGAQVPDFLNFVESEMKQGI